MTDTRPAIARAWVQFVDSCRAAGHSLPGSYVDIALMARDALDLLDPDYEGEDDALIDDDDDPLHLLLLDTLNHAVDGCAFGLHRDAPEEAPPTPTPTPTGETP